MGNKPYFFEFDGSDLIVKVDPNADGQAVLEVKVALAEIPDEVLSKIGEKKAEREK